MSYARVFLRGWSRREWLTVLVVAITTAFLLGTALLLASAGAYTETLEDDLSGTATVAEYDSLAAAQSAAGEGDVVVPLATATADGEDVTVAGIPPDAPDILSGASVDWRQARFPNVERGAAGPVSETRTVNFVGQQASVQLSVRPYAEAAAGEDPRTILPPWWYAAPASDVEELGVSSVLVFDSDGGIAGAVPTGRPAPPGTPLLAALPFLLAGVRELLTVLSVATIGGGVLVLVVVYSVTRMSIRDRHDDIRVVRSTGGSPRRLFAVLCARAGGLVVTGVALGYALGVVFTNAVTNLAVVAGLPVNLTGTVTPAVARLLLTLSGVLILSGLVAGALAAWPTVRTPPAQLRLRTRRSNRPREGSCPRHGDQLGAHGRWSPRWTARSDSGRAQPDASGSASGDSDDGHADRLRLRRSPGRVALGGVRSPRRHSKRDHRRIWCGPPLEQSRRRRHGRAAPLAGHQRERGSHLRRRPRRPAVHGPGGRLRRVRVGFGHEARQGESATIARRGSHRPAVGVDARRRGGRHHRPGWERHARRSARDGRRRVRRTGGQHAQRHAGDPAGGGTGARDRVGRRPHHPDRGPLRSTARARRARRGKRCRRHRCRRPVEGSSRRVVHGQRLPAQPRRDTGAFDGRPRRGEQRDARSAVGHARSRRGTRTTDPGDAFIGRDDDARRRGVHHSSPGVRPERALDSLGVAEARTPGCDDDRPRRSAERLVLVGSRGDRRL
ncbi:hypothetical protein C2R22_13600 [Salinigranum rubrum]|uniref:ABC3 transporter permease C-terminal domain-containing protein n=1 Tax=Salinigranum rubrum TaxID=755307 RepID=A0A2I8VPZ2_9EURY|nr:hypothetical protein C2R22_13600 [Salinigranum rubrum]